MVRKFNGMNENTLLCTNQLRITYINTNKTKCKMGGLIAKRLIPDKLIQKLTEKYQYATGTIEFGLLDAYTLNGCVFTIMGVALLLQKHNFQYKTSRYIKKSVPPQLSR